LIKNVLILADVQDCQGVSASEMTDIVSGGALNSTHSLLLAGFNSKLICNALKIWQVFGSLPVCCI